jgi:NADH-quinone oxidoreductase subunit M
MGVDGISTWLVVLTTFLTPLCVLISWKSIHERVKEFFILLLILETALIGVFVSLDLFLFYFFWEATLIPMALLIGMYGHGRKVYAAVKFFLYTMIASVFMLAAILWLYAKTGSFDFVSIQAAIHNGQVQHFANAATWLFLGFFIAFAVKVPLFPFHTWLPDAHVEAPTAGSVLLAGVLLKMGTYGMLRFNLGLFPEQSRANAWWVMILALIGIIYGALVALVQPNLKKLIAYSSISHLGFVVLGLFSFTQAGLDGATFVMLAHGVSTGALFMLAGILYERRHTYEINEFGGLATPMPVYATFFLFITLASLGLPLLNGFIGEFLVLSGAFQDRAIYGVLGATGVIWSACYLLWMYQRVFFSKVTRETNQSLPDLDMRERVALWPAALAALIMGVAPLIWLNAFDPAAQAILAPFAQLASKVVGK